ncbi:SIR2 family protein [Pandoraea pnomenusa]|uniref:SIR2 family protein n=1 Tax=Pandoraea pnomenusa TaxID=93220 RepID=UPI001147358B|nr:SIR2 family protein [Pandoraea pnomenusa]QDH60969.1 SIR2 family protein [Pandoraea pnomenusa]
MPLDYGQYREEVAADVAKTLAAGGCQPILFIGSGFSKRYMSAPNWEELLSHMAEACPRIKKNFAYYKQTYGDPIKIGAVFAEEYKEWAWEEGRGEFPDELFDARWPTDIFFKFKVAEYLRQLTPNELKKIADPDLARELQALTALHPHAVITTNYDRLLELIFEEYEPIVGQQILRLSHMSIGEIFKIHGCVSVPESIVITEQDYALFDADKKYLSAKLLTYFAEHPLLFVGYAASDPNIKSILDDVDHMIRAQFDLIPNIYILEWDDKLTDQSYPARDRVILVGNGREIRVKSIVASDFEWVFKAFGSGGTLEKVNLKLLRSLLARTVQLIRTDVPRHTVEVDYQTLEHAVGDGGGFAKLFGITTIADPAGINAAYPYTLSQVGQQLGFNGWNHAQKLLDTLKDAEGIDIKASDNAYHIAVPAGKTSVNRRYSQRTVDVLRKLHTGEPYELDRATLPVVE